MCNKPIETFSFRALGILEKFIQEQNIEEWLIPSSICFSVPALFYKNKKKVKFYDFGYDPSVIINLINDKNKQGVLVCGYFGEKWDLSYLKLIKKKCDILIEDACLEIPITNFNQLSERFKYSDLILFSTGKGKQIDLGYGAIGYSKTKVYHETVTYNTQCRDLTYSILDAEWKKLIIQNENLSNFLILIEDEWINDSTLENTGSYINQIEYKKIEALKHKRSINKIYKEGIPKSFWFMNEHTSWIFNIIVDQPDVLIQELFLKNLFASRHYVNFAKIFNNDNSFAKSSLIENYIVNLFNDFHITSDQASNIVKIFSSLYENRKIKPININL